MADNDQLNDEYQFPEVDPLNPDVLNESQGTTSETQEEIQPIVGSQQHNVKRNAIIAVVVFILVMISYKYVGSYFTGDNSQVSEITPAKTTTPIMPPPEPQPIVSAPPEPEPIVSKPEVSPEVSSKLSAIADAQDTLNAQVSQFNDQIGSINSNIEGLTNKIAELNRTITGLQNRLEVQAHEIERLNVKPEPKVARVSVKKISHHLKFYVQAVIPGRAWLVATNGSTLTVREGSIIPGYGIVKLIDSNQGRVLTSSGQVIRFSQQDS